MRISELVLESQKMVKLTHPELAAKASVGLRFLRELGQGKRALRMDKVNLVLRMFEFELGSVKYPI